MQGTGPRTISVKRMARIAGLLSLFVVSATLCSCHLARNPKSLKVDDSCGKANSALDSLLRGAGRQVDLRRPVFLDDAISKLLPEYQRDLRPQIETLGGLAKRSEKLIREIMPLIQKAFADYSLLGSETAAFQNRNHEFVQTVGKQFYSAPSISSFLIIEESRGTRRRGIWVLAGADGTINCYTMKNVLDLFNGYKDLVSMSCDRSGLVAMDRALYFSTGGTITSKKRRAGATTITILVGWCGAGPGMGLWRAMPILWKGPTAKAGREEDHNK